VTGGHLAAAAALLLALAACSSGDEPLEVVDPGAAPANPTWEQVEAIIVPNCSPCHKDGGDDKTGDRLRLLDDGEDQDYSTCEGIQEGLSGIVKTVLRDGSMPPAPGRASANGKS